ncbi:MAG: C40 family peptidase [Lachnospiraceae bacterium]|nr:C40 family peptidase [Lachnospiraceae bacterium]
MTAAALLFSGMNIDAFAKEGTGLPSAGIDFTLASNGTSVKSLQDEKEAAASPTPTAPAEDIKTIAGALPTATGNVTEDVPEEPIKEEKVIEETMMATTTKTIEQKEKEIETKKEEESFKSLVIADVNDYVNVRSIPSEEGEIVGKLYDDSVGEFISEQDGWYEITSGNVTGFVKAEYCVTGDAAVSLAKEVGTRIATVTTTTLKVRKEPSLEAEVLGLVPIEDQLLVTEELEGWVKVDIEEGYGYVSLDYVTLSTEFVKAESKAEEEARLAREEEERRAAQAAAQAAVGSSKKTGTGAQEVNPPVITGTSGSELGQAVADFACQFVGNPYVWGGTSLTNGADCSGFVMSVYANFGVSLPHSSAADRHVGSAVDGLENAQPGDLVCYSGHVGIYIGGGQIVHASSAKTGIIISSASYRTPLSVRRIF